MLEGTSIQFAPLVPEPVLWVLTGAAVLVLAVLWWRRAAGAAWRTLAAAMLLLALANPAIVTEERAENPDIALLVVDRSQSQQISDRPQTTDAAIAALERQLEQMDNLEVRRVEVTSGSLGEAADRGTRLFDALAQARSDIPIRQFAGAIAITDGQVHDAPDLATESAPSGPLHVLLTGNEDEQDRRLVVVNAPRFGIVDRPLGLTLRIDDPASPPGTLVPVRVRRNGAEAQETVVSLPVGVDVPLPLTLDRRGPTVLELIADAGPAELTLENNRAVLSLNGVRDRLRVLLVSGEPHSGERTWRSLLKSDPSVDLVHFTILRPPEKQDGTPIRELSLISFPVRELFELKLEEFDLIIFDRYRRRGVLPYAYLSNIVEYVQNGGALLKAVGPTFATPLSLHATPLGRILPGEPTGQVFEQGFRPMVTGIGHRHPVTADLPDANRPAREDIEAIDAEWGRWFRQVNVRHISGDVLMTGVANRPLVILDRIGQGRVAQVLSDHMWLWTRGYEGGGPQAELLRRTAHWLMKEPDLEENDLRAEVRGDQVHIMRRSLTEKDNPVTVSGPDGSEQSVDLVEDDSGRAVATVRIDKAGVYRIADDEHVSIAAAGPPNPVELADMRSTAALVKEVVDATAGTVFRLADFADRGAAPEVRRVRPDRSKAGRSWLGLMENGDYQVIGLRQVPLIHPLIALALAAAFLVLAWRREAQ
ncbi:MAG: hypothetical protein QNJ94_23155 [Alphaproteobacteria bacterium]|nr:hypothetical protein [Alphaproteobacteria bacterium]